LPTNSCKAYNTYIHSLAIARNKQSAQGERTNEAKRPVLVQFDYSQIKLFF